MRTSEVLACAAEWIEAVGLNQGQFACDGNVCMIGAVFAACGVDPVKHERHEALEAYDAWCVLEDALRWPASWNDRPGRTGKEVSAELRRLAEQQARAGR